MDYTLRALTLALQPITKSNSQKHLEFFSNMRRKVIQQHNSISVYCTARVWGVERDEDEAFHWCKKSAGECVLDAQFQLGVMYLHGEGVEEDDVLALEWLWQAREVLQFVLQNDFTTGC